MPPKVLNQAVKRNSARFPEDFRFQLTKGETESLRSHFVTLNEPFGNKGDKTKRGKHLKYLPYAFTQEGVAMLSSVLNSEQAIQVNIAIMRAFVKLRELLLTNKELAEKIEELERKVGKHDEKIIEIFEVIKKLLEPPPEPQKPPIGFR